MTSSVIAVDASLRPRIPRALHVYNEPASVLLTDVNVNVPLYLLPFVTRTDELEGLVKITPFLNHSNVMDVATW